MTGFLLFGGYRYYPSGGWTDFIGQFPTLESAAEAGEAAEVGWWHIVHDGKIVLHHYQAKPNGDRQ